VRARRDCGDPEGLRPAEPLADQPADRGGGLVDVDPDRADEQWFRGIARGRVPLVALHPNPRRQGPIRVEPPRERLAVERLAERRFEPGALLVAHGVHRSVESLVKPRQVEEVEPRGRDSRHGDMAHILAPQPVEERDRGVGRVGPANGAGLEPEPVEGAVGSDDSPS